MVFGASVIFSIILAYANKINSQINRNGEVHRNAPGEGAYEANLLLEIEGLEAAKEITILVPEQRLTKEEEQQILEQAIAEAMELFLGENESLDQIQKQVGIQTEYQLGLVQASWEFSEPWLIDTNGQIREEELVADGQVVEARVLLNCEDSKLIHLFSFTVYKEKKSETEKLHEEIIRYILTEGKEEGVEELALPKEVNGYPLIWSEVKSKTPLQILLLGTLASFLMPLLEKQKEKENQKKREEALMRQYPEMVTKLSLLMGAGMTLFAAWRKITEMYLTARGENAVPQMLVYEEMLYTRREIENGKSEVAAYANFGERCKLQKYRKLSSYLTQNLKKGNNGLQIVLEREADEVLEERKALAKQYSEEAGTKLLLPMLLMLGIVIFIIMVPAILTLQIGL